MLDVPCVQRVSATRVAASGAVACVAVVARALYVAPAQKCECEAAPSERQLYVANVEVGLAWTAILGLAWVSIREVYKAASKLRDSKNLKATLWGLLNYRLENWWARSPAAIPLSLLYVTLTVNMVGGLLYNACTGESLGTAIFRTWTFLSDPSAHTELDSLGATLLGFVLTVLGMIICGFLISIITDMVNEHVASIKKGNSHVIEAGHTAILGFSTNLRPLIAQIAIANESEGGGAVVVLASRPNEFLQKEVSYMAPDEVKSTQVVVRSGSPLRVQDLEVASARTARAIIILADNEVSAEESDAVVMRTVLALSAFESLDGHIVAELRDVDNQDHIQLISRHNIECVVAHDFIGRLMIQCARQPQLADVIESLYGFNDDEIYMEKWPALVGLSFAQVSRAFDFAIPIGVKRGDNVTVNPADPWSFFIQADDEIVVVAEDNDTYAPVADLDAIETPPRPQKIVSSIPDAQRPQHFLFLGWRRDVMDMIRFLDDILSAGSTLTIMSMLPVTQRLTDLAENGRRLDLHSLALHHVVGNHVSRRQLARLPLCWYDAILILSEKSQEAKVLATDSLSCASLVLVRDIQAHKACPSKPPSGFLNSSPAARAGPLSPKRLCATTVNLNHDATSSLATFGHLQGTSSHDPSLGFDDNGDDAANYARHHRETSVVSPGPGDPALANSSLAVHANSSVRSSSDETPRGSLRRESPNLLERLLVEARKSDDRDDDDDDYVAARPATPSNAGDDASAADEAADTQTSVSRRREAKTQIICELLDSQMRYQLTRFCDVIASNDFVSRILAMVSERAEINQVLLSLLSERGSEILLRPLRDYARHKERLNFYDLAARALAAGEILIGYTCNDDNAGKLVINPKDKRVCLTWSNSDRLAVIGTDKTARQPTV